VCSTPPVDDGNVDRKQLNSSRFTSNIPRLLFAYSSLSNKKYALPHIFLLENASQKVVSSAQ